LNTALLYRRRADLGVMRGHRRSRRQWDVAEEGRLDGEAGFADEVGIGPSIGS
jgi:hypothetical protein